METSRLRRNPRELAKVPVVENRPLHALARSSLATHPASAALNSYPSPRNERRATSGWGPGQGQNRRGWGQGRGGSILPSPYTTPSNIQSLPLDASASQSSSVECHVLSGWLTADRAHPFVFVTVQPAPECEQGVPANPSRHRADPPSRWSAMHGNCDYLLVFRPPSR